MSSGETKKTSFFDQIKEFVVILGGNFIVLILLLLVVNYFLAPFDIKSHLDSVSQEIHNLREDIGNLTKEVRAMRTNGAAKASK